MFMRRRSEERYQLWEQLRHGQHPDPVSAIRDDFNARAVLLLIPPGTDGEAPEAQLARQLQRGGAQCVYEGNDGGRLYALPEKQNPSE